MGNETKKSTAFELPAVGYKKNAEGRIVNSNGLTYDEYVAIDQYKKIKETAQSGNNTNKGYENSGKTRDDYDASVRGGNKKEAESESSSAGKTVEIELPNPNGSKPGPGKQSETLTVPVTQYEYYTLPDLDYTEEEKNAKEELALSKNSLEKANQIKSAYEKMLSSLTSQSEEKYKTLAEYEKKLTQMQGSLKDADGLIENYNALADEYSKLSGKYDSELKKLYSDIDSAYASYKKDPTDELYSKYVNAVGSYNSYLDKTKNELSGYESQMNALMEQYNTSGMGAYYDEYNKTFGEYNSIKEELDKIAKEYDGYLAEYGDVTKLYETKYSQYSSKFDKLSSVYERVNAEYERWRASVRNSEVVRAEADALDKAINDLWKKKKTAESRRADLDAGTARPKDHRKINEEIAALDAEISKYEKELTALKGKRDLTYDELSSSEAIEKAEYYASYTERDDFAEGSAYESTFGKEKEDAPYMTLVEMGNTLYGDLKYDYINGDEEAKLYAISLNEGLADPFEEYGYMKDEEIAIYNYIYKTEGKESAEAFLSDLMEDLTYRQMTKETGDYKAYADKHPVLGSLLSILTNTMKPIAAIGQLGDYLLDGKIDTNASYNRASYLTSALREGASKDMNAVGKFFYNTGMSIADFATVTALTGGSGASLAIMGMSSAADTTIEAKERGLSDGQAIVLGAASGLIEAATEKIGLDNLMKKIAGGGKGVKGVLKGILSQSLSEGGEELLSAIGNDIVDILISQDKSKWETEIDALMEKDSSLSRNEAWGKVFGSHLLEYGLSGLGGMLSGAVTGLGGVGIKALTGGFKKLDTSKMEKHEIKTPEEAKIEKKDDKYPEPYEIIKDAKNAPAYSDYYKYADMVEKSDKLTSENILRLEELWKKHQDLPEAISEIKELAGEGKTLDEVEKSVRENYDVETITYAEIEDAYNEATEKPMAGTKATDKEYISMEDFANSESAVWHNVDYNDDASKSNIMQEVHDSMVSDGSVVKVSDSTLQNVGESYPDLRDLKKKERAPLLKEAMSKLKNNLKQFLGTFKNQSFDFEVNGKILEAKLYNTGINEVLEKITQEKANMLYTTEEIFKNARYLYSTTDYDGDPNVYRWNYFYTPVQIGEDIVGVRIAVRDIAEGQEHLPESQIYNWNIKKDTSLGGVQPVVSDSSHDASSDVSADTSLDGVGRGTDNRISHGVSSDVSNNSISQKADFDNTFSKNNNENTDSNNKNELDEPEENEVTRRIAEIEDERSWREPSDSARDRFYADEADLIRDLKAKGEYENHPIRKARTETARSGIVYGASESDIALAERLSKALGRDILFFSEEARNDNIKNGVWDRDAIWINVKHDPEKTVPWIIAHELAHTIEGTKAYGRLKKYVRSELGEEAFKKQCDDLLDMYSQSEVEFEVVSNYVADHLLTDEAAIMKLVRGNRTLAEKLLSILDKILEKIGIYGKRTEERLALERMRRIYLNALAEQANAAQPRDGIDTIGEGQKKKAADVDSLSGDEYLKELDDLLDSGEISEDEYNELYEEYVNQKNTERPTASYSLSPNAQKDVTRALYDKNYQGEVKLTDSSPSILISQKGVKNLPMLMNASHLRENIFTEVQAKKYGFRISSDINYHGLGTELFLKVIDGLDDVTEAYRGTAKAEKSERRENYFLLVSQYTDKDGNIINVPIYINEKGLYNRVFIDTNKISTVFGRSEFRKYISEQIKKGNLVRIKNRSIQTSESTSPINADYSKNASDDSISHSKPNVNTSKKNNFPFSKNAKKSTSKKDIEVSYTKFAVSVENQVSRVAGSWYDKAWRTLKIPQDFGKGWLYSLTRKVADEYMIQGKFSTDTLEKLFNDCYNMAKHYSENYVEKYSELLEFLNSSEVMLNIGDLDNIGNPLTAMGNKGFKMSKNSVSGTTVDNLYENAQKIAPELFPSEITESSERLARIVKILSDGNMTEVFLEETNSSDSELFKEQKKKNFLEKIAYDTIFIKRARNQMLAEIDAKKLLKDNQNLETLVISDAQDKNMESYEAFSDRVSEKYTTIIKNFDKKVLNALKKSEKSVIIKMQDALKLPSIAKNTFLPDIVHALINEYLETGGITQEATREIFSHAYERCIALNESFSETYKPVEEYFKKTKLHLPEDMRSQMWWHRKFINNPHGITSFVKNGGVTIRDAYRELSEILPMLFPETITDDAKKMSKIISVAREIFAISETNDEFCGEDADMFKEFSFNQFDQSITDFVRELSFSKRYIEAVSQRMAQEGIVVPDAETLFETYKNLKKLRTASARAVANNALTPVEENYVKDLLTGRITLEQIPTEHYNVRAIKAVFEAKQPYENAMQVIKAYHNHRKSEQYIRADELLDGFDDWKAPKAGLKLSMNTMERNIYGMVKDTDRAEAIIEEYFSPIHKHEAESTRYKNKFLDKIRALKISTKVEKGNKDTEASAVQFVGEAESHIMRLENNKRLKKSGGLTLEEWQKALSDFKMRNPELDYDRIASCVKVFREIYDQLISDMNRARMLNGYEPIEYRYAYFPHFHRDMPTSKWGKFTAWLGVDQETQTLPATIAGMTENFKPGIRWLSAAQERRMSETEYDCLEGFDRYISGAADVIFHTEDIQKLRSFANRIRYQASDDVIRARIIAIEENTELSDEEKHKRISEIAESRFTLSAFVNELDEYTNLLAGKKLRADRQSEQDMGRTFYNWSKWLKSRFGANMIAGNIGSAMTNFIPIAQAAGITRNQMLKAMYQQIKSGFADDGFADRSDFLTNRVIGTDRLKKTTSDKISDVLGTPMELIDGFSSGTIVRALYNQAKHDGLSDAEAMDRANARAAEIMADRSKGAMPTLFSRSGFFTAIFTQFQLEVANQYGYLMKDLPRYLRRDKHIIAKLIGALFKIFLLSYLFNDLYEAAFGRRAAFDPIDIVNDAIGDATGYKLPNMVDAVEDMIDGESFGDVFKTEKKGTAAAVKGLATNAAEELPFIGGILGGGRIPISSAMPDVGKLFDAFTKDVSVKKKLKTLAGELDSLFYIIPPYGGGQLRKMLDAIPSIAQGGSYTYDNAGNRQLQYPTQTGGTVSDVFEAGRSAIFGKSSSRYAREWVESGFDTFSVNETSAYEEILDKGFSKKVAFDAVRDYGKAKGSLSRKVDKIDALLSIGADEDINYVIYKHLIASDSEVAELDSRLAEFENHGLGLEDYFEVVSTDSNFYRSTKKQTAFWEMVDSGTSAEDAISSLVSDMVEDDSGVASENETKKNEFTESEMKVISALSENGFTAEEAEGMVKEFEKIEPTNGRKKAGQYQKAESIVNTVSDPIKQLDALSSVMSNKQYQIMKLAYETYNIEPSLYIKVYLAAEKLSYETTGKTDVNKTELKTVLDDLELNDGKKAQLYQFITNEDVTLNPYSFEHASFVKEDMDALFA